jgi:Fe-S-cluster containining protein
MNIESTQSPRNRWCEHAMPSCGGCAIYDQRPSECREFNCLWIQGVMEDKHRPDKIGIVFTLWDAPSICHLCEQTQGKLIVGFPNGDEAMRNKRSQNAAQAASHANLILIWGVKLVWLYGPKHLRIEALPAVKKLCDENNRVLQ